MNYKLLFAIALCVSTPYGACAAAEAGHEGHDCHEDEGQDGHEGHGEEAPDMVTVSTRGQVAAGIELGRVSAGGRAARFSANGRVVQDAGGVYHLKAAADGVFTASARLGQQVVKGEKIGSVGEAALLAPEQGVVSGGPAGAGAAVRAGDILYTITGTDPVWAVLDVAEKELSRLEPGRPASVRSAAWPGKTFEGEIVFVAPEIDEVSRTIKTRVRLPNPGGRLKFGMFVTAELQAGGGPAGPSVPSGALQSLPRGQAVFVRIAPDKFQARYVRAGREQDGRTEILDGLRPGETVAVKGAFLLKSELMKERIGGHSH